MNISEKDLKFEKEKLKKVNKLLKDILESLGRDLLHNEEELKEFRKFTWESKSDMDSTELKQVISDDALEAGRIVSKQEYFKKLCKIKDSPYFASIIFEDEEKVKKEINISLTYLYANNNENILYDWRSPISSLFYDYEVGPCSYEAPGGVIEGNLLRKRQYKIENGKLIRVFDNSINVQDDLLQEVLSNASSDKMKNIVNTIQKEQNCVIRNIENKNLIVQGIAGSGKTSVALHRIAFLLYKIKNLTSSNVLIFSPNNVFTEYISNVLPELGEDNTLQTTFHDYLSSQISEFKYVESFIDFIARYYKYEETNIDLVRYKQSDEIIKDIESFVKDLGTKVCFTNGFTENHVYDYDKLILNDFIKNRYSSVPIYQRIEEMADKFSENNYEGTLKKSAVYRKLLYENLSISKKVKDIFVMFFQSDFAKIKMNDIEIKAFLSNKYIKYEDALVYVYLKGLLSGFDTNIDIKQIVIDEAQDYSYLQYLILTKIFKKASYTILGDINQTINPYYKYNDLYVLNNLIPSAYYELSKTYRSSEEIINFTNQILGLKHVCAIRRENKKEVLVRKSDTKELSTMIKKDIDYLRSEYSSVAIITKDDTEAQKIYDMLNGYEELSLVDTKSIKFNKKLLVIPAYLSKGLEFDSVIVYNDSDNKYKKDEKNLLYVACTRSQHELIIYN